MRLFIAITLPETVQDALADLGNGLPGARWVAPENLHLTLRFLGEIDRRDAEDIDAALAEIRAPGFPLSIVGVDRFGDNRRLRQLWAGVEPHPGLLHLQSKVESAVVRSGLAPERRKFKPHITLARFKSNPGDKLGAFLSRHGLFRLPPFEVDRFGLYSSFLSSGGSIYSEEAVYELTPDLAAVQAREG